MQQIVAGCLLALALVSATGSKVSAATPMFDNHTPHVTRPKLSPGVLLSPQNMPPLPFRQPQLGPQIKRAYSDDVDLRSTAFVPPRDAFKPDFPVPNEQKWIRVDLSDQIVIAYEHDKPVRAFVISSGLPGTPTVTGEFRIRVKVRSQTMSGGSSELGTFYSLPNVEWVQYFYKDYGFHGTYWHNNFGNPMSHGCVNMTNADARWLFDWAAPSYSGDILWQRSSDANPGTLVIVQE